MAQIKRLDTIRQLLQQQKKVVVSELAVQFGVTEETIRRDLDKLCDEGIAVRTYGGAILSGDNTPDNIDFARRARKHSREKVIMANMVSSQIRSNASIACDASSTAVAAINALRDRSDCTVLTYSVQAVNILEDSDIKVLCTGGQFYRQSLSFNGSVAKRVLKSYNTDFLLFSCKAISLDGGAYDSSDDEAELKKIMIQNSQRRILLADHSKFNKVAFVHSCSFEDIDVIITDQKPSPEWLEAMEKYDIELIYPN